jgi:hypothetical protein
MFSSYLKELMAQEGLTKVASPQGDVDSRLQSHKEKTSSMGPDTKA